MPIGLIYSGFQLGAPINAEADAQGCLYVDPQSSALHLDTDTLQPSDQAPDRFHFARPLRRVSRELLPSSPMNQHHRPDRRRIEKRFRGVHRDADAPMTRRSAWNRRAAMNGHASGYIDRVIHQPQRTFAPSWNFTINPEASRGSNGQPPFALGNVPPSAAC